MSDDLETAARLLELEPKWLQPFDEPDPFNEGRRVAGFLSRKPDHRYGALAITHVDGHPAPQRVLATPKLHYPFDRAGTFRFPPVRRISIYEKLDGTNVTAYAYRDAAGEVSATFKLRLFPFLRNSRFGPFLAFWRELLAELGDLAATVRAGGPSLSFEMYGRRNRHLIEYEVPLATALLFGIDPRGGLVGPESLGLPGVPRPRLFARLAAGEDPVERYQRLREEIERTNRPAEEERLVGSEGAVWFIEGPDLALSLWKLKPESVEAIHWAAGINKAAVLATCRNLLETEDSLTYEALEPLLLEEYAAKEIDGFRSHIDLCIEQVRRDVEYRARVLEAYRRLGVSIHADKGAVMRALSKDFPRAEMKKVHSIILAEES